MGAMPSLIPPVIPAGLLAASTQPVLSLDRDLSLRPWSVRDAPTIVAAYADPVMGYWHSRTVDSEVEARALIERWLSAWSAGSGANWAVVRTVSAGGEGNVLGGMALGRIDTGLGCGECAYWILPAARGGGVATRALGALANWAFADAGFHRLSLIHSTSNDASCRVATKAGFAPEGVERSSILHADGWHDMHVHARISDR
jgi:[ribosomal protein S5]-alanine N-acetyltransferase